MKSKLYTLIIALTLLWAPEFVSVQAQTNNNETRPSSQTQRSQQAQPVRSDTPNYTLAQNKSFAHWSIGVGGGISLFDGDIVNINVVNVLR